MKELKEFYDKQIGILQEEYTNWVASNRKMRSIELARDQIKPEGNISASPALDVLNAAYEKEKVWNKEATTKMYAHKHFIEQIEVFAREHGEKWKCVYAIFGY